MLWSLWLWELEIQLDPSGNTWSFIQSHFGLISRTRLEILFCHQETNTHHGLSRDSDHDEQQTSWIPLQVLEPSDIIIKTTIGMGNLQTSLTLGISEGESQTCTEEESPHNSCVRERRRVPDGLWGFLIVPEGSWWYHWLHQKNQLLRITPTSWFRQEMSNSKVCWEKPTCLVFSVQRNCVVLLVLLWVSVWLCLLLPVP